MNQVRPPYDERSLQRLEWGALLSLIAARCAFAPSRELALAIRPALGDPLAARRRELTEEITVLRQHGEDPHVGGAADLRPALDRAEKGGVLDGTALFTVAETLRVAERLKGELAKGGPALGRVAEEIALCRSLRGQLERALLPDGTLADTASPLLGGLRANHRNALERLRTRLEGLAHAKAYSPHLQEPIVTLRNGRYVLPVRAEAKSKVPGIVHDTSATGQTIWIEPLEVVELGNAAREAETAVAAEEARIFGTLSALVGSEVDALRATCALFADVDLARATADTAAEADWNFAATRSDDLLSLRQARHPRLLGTVVPIDLELDAAQRVLLITGPNTGGKTVALKTVGLLIAAHHAGLPISAGAGSGIPPTGGLWADIGDDQSIAQSLSTFSGHLTSILRIHRHAEAGDLILLDEAGAGTDPAEGAALAAAIIDDFRLRGARLLATSHYAELKQYAHVTDGVVNGAVEFDLVTLRPTYRLIVGTPGGSQAFAIAERLGLPAHLLASGQARRSDQGAALDASLTAAATAREVAREAQQVAEGLQRRAEEALQQAVQLRNRAEEELRDARERAGAEATAAAEQLLMQVERLRAALRDGALTPAVQDASDALREGLNARPNTVAASLSLGAAAETPALGDEVQLQSGARGEVIELLSDGRLMIALGSMRISVEAHDIAATFGRRAARPMAVVRPAVSPDATARLDLRGARVEDAIAALESRIDAVLLSGGERLEIIHGVGTGALRDAVRRRLRELPEVREVRDADAPGRDGVTIALF
ncbi:MAG: endonuclease MutS2 [Candidatus Limnocylindrus sp.]